MRHGRNPMVLEHFGTVDADITFPLCMGNTSGRPSFLSARATSGVHSRWASIWGSRFGIGYVGTLKKKPRRVVREDTRPRGDEARLPWEPTLEA